MHFTDSLASRSRDRSSWSQFESFTFKKQDRQDVRVALLTSHQRLIILSAGLLGIALLHLSSQTPLPRVTVPAPKSTRRARVSEVKPGMTDMVSFSHKTAAYQEAP